MIFAAVLVALLGLAGCGEVAHTHPDPAALPARYEIVAESAPTDSPLRATTEVTNLVAFTGELWASTSQWMAPAPVGGAILRRTSPRAPWGVVLQTDQLRVMGLEAFRVPSAGGGTDEVLLVQAQPPDAPHQIRWSVAPDRSLAESFALPDAGGTVRSFGANVAPDGSATFFAGVQPTGILAGTWDAAARTIRWSPTPELVVGGAGLDQKVTGFASCGGAAWTTVRGTLYRRRTDGGIDPATGGPWQPAWSVEVANPDNSGLRGVTCIEHDGAPAILVGVEGSGEIVRFDGVDRLRSSIEAAPLVPVPELDTRALIDSTLREWGHDVPAAGSGAVGYTIPAYNDFTGIGGGVIATGVEWSYEAGACPSSRRCQPERTFDAQACLLRRGGGDGTSAPRWELRCLAVPADSPNPIPVPVPPGAAFVAVRSLLPLPWDANAIGLAGYDSNFVTSDGTGWIGVVSAGDLRR
jgi:hypothetical protein